MRARVWSAVAAFVVACGGGDSVEPAVEPGAGDPPSSEPSEGGAPPPASTPDAAAPDGAAPACAGKGGAPGDFPTTITSGGAERKFDLHVPASYDGAAPMPLVLVFHGYTMSASSIAKATHFAAAADKRGVIVAFPEGVSSGFNAGDCCGTAQSNGVDDVGFARDLVDAVSAKYCVDPKRVYATGFSNGGFMSYRLACELSDRVAAVAPVSGMLGIDPSTCAPKRPVPVLHVHGTSDPIVPYNGGGLSNFRSAQVSVDAFRTKNECSGAGAKVYENGDVTCTSWGTCKAGADVELCKVTGGMHQWPGGDTLPYGGIATKDLDATNAVLDFFAAHPMP